MDPAARHVRPHACRQIPRAPAQGELADSEPSTSDPVLLPHVGLHHETSTPALTHDRTHCLPGATTMPRAQGSGRARWSSRRPRARHFVQRRDTDELRR